MKGKIVAFGLLLILASVLAVAQSASVPVWIEEAELEGTTIWQNGWNQLDIERNDKVELRLELQSWENVDNVEVRASISGYEHGNVAPITDRIGPFDMDANVTYVRKLQVALPDDVELDDYKLRIELSNRNGFAQVYHYDLQIDAPRNAMKITDVTFNPGSTLVAGQSLLGRVRLENKGQRDQDDVKVTMSVPALGLTATQYIEEVDNGDEQEETEEFFLRLPRCATPGSYEVNVDAFFNNNHNKVSATSKITVLENEDCREPEPVVVVQQVNQTQTPAQPQTSGLRTALEIILLVLVALLIVVGLVIGFSRMKDE